MINFLENLDKQISLFLNGLHCPALDFLMYHITQLYFSLFVYSAVIVVFIVFKKKLAWREIVFAIIAVFLASFIANTLLKPMVARLRPCNTPDVQNALLIVNNYTRTGFSFVSSHAATGFALAVYVCLSLRNKYVSTLILLWVFVYSYSRIYLGVHFFGDVVCGAIVGTFCGWTAYKLNKIEAERRL